jgi:hypothetical protein
MAVDPPTTAASGARRIVVDADHFAVRFLVPVVALAVAVLFHLLTYALLADMLDEQGVAPGCVVVPGDLLAFFAGAYLTEHLLKRIAPARRHALLDDHSVALVDRRSKGAGRSPSNGGAWSTPRAGALRSCGALAPKGWYCLALHCPRRAGHDPLHVHGRKEMEHLPGYEHFFRLRLRKETRTNPDPAPSPSSAACWRSKTGAERWCRSATISRAVTALMSSVHEWVSPAFGKKRGRTIRALLLLARR